jgi:HK97 family phage portal protein
MSIFNRALSLFQRKSNPAFAQYAQYGRLPEPVTMGGNPRAYAKEGYRRNDTAHKCIDYIARNLAGIRIALYSDATRKREITSHPILDLLSHPNSDMSYQDFIESVASFTLLYGNSYMYGIRAGKSGPPDEIWSLRPDRVDIVPNGQMIVRYDYRIKEPATPLDAGDVGHTKYWSPDDDLYGLSPIEVAALMIDQTLAARKWNLSLLQNAGQPAGAWVVPTTMDKKSRDTLEDKLNKKYAGSKNAGRIPVLDGGLKFQPTGIGPADMSYLDLLTHNAAGVANIYNLAPQIVGDTSASTYDNFEQAVYGSYTEAIFPLADKVICGTLNRWLVPQYGKSSLYLGYDKQSVETIQSVMQAQEGAKADRWTKIYTAGGCTLAQYQEKIGIEPDPQGNVYRIKDTIIPADKLEDYAIQSMTAPAAPPKPLPEGTPPPGVTVDADPHPALPAPAKVPALPAPKKSIKALDLSTDEQKSTYWKSIDASRDRLTDQAQAQLADFFDTQQKAVIKAVNNAALPSTAQYKVATALSNTKDQLKSTLLTIYKSTAGDIGTQVSRELKTGLRYAHKDAVQDFIDQFGSDVLEYLLQLAGTKVKQINDTTLASIQSELSDGVAAGESIPSLAKRIDNLYLEQIIPNRSKTIARTEVTAASNYGSIQAAKQSGLKLTKVWLATPGSRTREDHAAADGQEVGIDDTFDVGGEPLAYPGDPSGSAENVINCRCTTYYNRQADDEDEDEDDDEETEKARTRNAYRKYMRTLA